MPTVTDDSEAGICNEALSLCQSKGRITSLTDPNSKAARNCLLHYAQTRDELLRGYYWNFATFWVTLAAALPVPLAGGYSAAFALPGDTLRVLEVNGLGKKQWTVEHDLRLLATSAAPLTVRLIKRVEAPGKWDKLFRGLMVHALAIKLAPTMARSRSIKSDLKSDWYALVNEAKKIDSFEKDEDGNEPQYVPGYIAVRGGWPGWPWR